MNEEASKIIGEKAELALIARASDHLKRGLEVTFNVHEFGNPVMLTKRIQHATMNYVCPEPDTCEICNWKPTSIPLRAKIKRFPRRMQFKLAYWIYKLAERMGFQYECDHDSDY